MNINPKAILNDRLFPPKAFYFFYFAAGAALLPFLVLYYEEIGLSGQQIGLLASIPPLVSMFGPSLWGGLADATRRHQTLLKVAILGAIVWAWVLSFSTSMLWLPLVVLLFAFFVSPITPLVDNTVFEMLGDASDRYGKIRLWGAIGWGVVGPIIGWVVQQTGLHWSFYGYMLLMGATLLVSLQLPVSTASIGGAFWRGLKTLLQNRDWIVFLILIFIGGIGFSMVHNYLFLYMKDINASRTLMGWSLTFATISEIGIFFFSGQLIKRWGNRRILVVALALLGVRMILYGVIRNPMMVLVVQLLHGPTFSAMWVAGVSYANKIAPKGLGATAQGILHSVNFGLGAATGAVIGGILLEQLGSSMMYLYGGVGMLAGVLIFLLFGWRRR